MQPGVEHIESWLSNRIFVGGFVSVVLNAENENICSLTIVEC